MKKIMFLFLMVMGLMSSLYALDTGQIGCDVEKSQTFSTIDGVDCDVIISSTVALDATYASLEDRQHTTQAYLDTHIIGPEDFKLTLKHEAIAALLTKVDICIIIGGYSKYMGEGGV